MANIGLVLSLSACSQASEPCEDGEPGLHLRVTFPFLGTGYELYGYVTYSDGHTQNFMLDPLSYKDTGVVDVKLPFSPEASSGLASFYILWNRYCYPATIDVNLAACNLIEGATNDCQTPDAGVLDAAAMGTIQAEKRPRAVDEIAILNRAPRTRRR